MPAAALGPEDRVGVGGPQPAKAELSEWKLERGLAVRLLKLPLREVSFALGVGETTCGCSQAGRSWGPRLFIC